MCLEVPGWVGKEMVNHMEERTSTGLSAKSQRRLLTVTPSLCSQCYFRWVAGMIKSSPSTGNRAKTECRETSNYVSIKPLRRWAVGAEFFQVLSEVKMPKGNPNTTFKKGVFWAFGLVSVLYLFANIAYVNYTFRSYASIINC